MKKTKYWIAAARPQTLPLAVSGILTAYFLASFYEVANEVVAFLAVITAAMLQILSNFANDLGDFESGTDNDKRLGPDRMLQKGHLSANAMKKAINLLGFLSLMSGIGLLAASFPLIGWQGFLSLLFLGIVAIWAAYAYTAGSNPYGYRGFGDIFVFIFFGPVSVLGGFYLQSGSLNTAILLPATTIGLLSTGVLNLNNIRDIENDRESQKMTVAVLLGYKKARIYHQVLLLLGFLCLGVFAFGLLPGHLRWLSLLSYLPIFAHFVHFKKVQEPIEHKPLLKELAVGTFLFCLILGILMQLLG